MAGSAFSQDSNDVLDATYVTLGDETSTFSNSFSLGSLTSGLIFNTVTAGVGALTTVDLGSLSTTGVNYYNFIPAASPAHSEGRLFYNSDSYSMSYYNDKSGVELNVGQELLIRVRNESGAQIDNGKAVYANGVGGGENRPLIELAQADDPFTSRIIGIATHDIPNNDYGYINHFGVISDIDTSAFFAGDSIWLSTSSAGDYQNTEPSSPNVSVFIGEVLTSDASTGSILLSTIGNTGSTVSGDSTSLSIPCRKDSAGTILAGEAVYITGYNAGQDLVLVELARSDVASTMPALGVALTSFTNSTAGDVIISGRLAGQNTSGFSVGDSLYVDPTTAGALTNSVPGQNYQIQKIGTVTRSNASNGVITISGAGRANAVPNFSAVNKYWRSTTGGAVIEDDISALGSTLLADATPEDMAETILSGSPLTSATVAGTDKVLIQDADDSDNLKTVTAQSIADLGGTPGLTPLQTVSVTSGSEMVFDTGITSASNQYMIKIADLQPATDDVEVHLQFSTDGGATWLAANYKMNTRVTSSATSSTIYNNGAFLSQVTLTDTATNGKVGNHAVASWAGTINLFNPAGTNYTMASLTGCTYTDKDFDIRGVESNFAMVTGSDVDAVRIYFSSGNIAKGKGTLYRLEEA